MRSLLPLSFALTLATLATFAACADPATIESSSGEVTADASAPCDATADGGACSSSPSTSPSAPANSDGGPPSNPPTSCAAAPAFGVEAPVALTTNLDFSPIGALVDTKHRAIVYGWATESGIALPDLFVARYSDTGAVDKTFGKGKGYETFDIRDVTNYLPEGLSATVDDSDRIVLVWGRTKRSAENNLDKVLTAMRTTSNGALDATFGNAGYVDDFGLGLGSAFDQSSGELKSMSLTGSNGIAALPGGSLLVVAVTRSSATNFGTGTVKETTQVSGLKLTASGVPEPGFRTNLPIPYASVATVRTFGSDAFVSNGKMVWKLTASGAPDPSFSLTVPILYRSLPDFVRRDDGTFLASGDDSVVLTDTNGKNATTFADVGGRLALRCDGRLVVASVAESLATTQLLDVNGKVDPARGTQGVVSYTKDADLSTSTATAIDPATGTVTAFYTRRKQGAGDALIAVRLHP